MIVRFCVLLFLRISCLIISFRIFLSVSFLHVLLLILAEDLDEFVVYLISRALCYVEGERKYVKWVPVDRLVVLAHVEEEGEFVR